MNSKSQSLVDEFLAADDLENIEEAKEPSEHQQSHSDNLFDPEASNISAAVPTNQSQEGLFVENQKPFHVGMLSDNRLA